MNRVGRFVPPNKQILRDISLGFYYGAKIGVLGLNGAGKSTLLRIMAGLDNDYTGEISRSPGYSVGLLAQEPVLDESKTVIEVVKEAVQPIVDLMARYDEVNAKFADPDADFDALVTEQAKLQEELDKYDAWNLDSRLELAMDALRCPPSDMQVNVLSGGEKRRVALTRLLLTEPDILLLDEPTNHLDAESVAWLEHHLRDYKGTVIAVTHDRYFLDNVAGWILELDRGYGIPWKGNYSSWLEQKQERVRLEEKSESKRQKTLERELEWIRMSPKARQSKGQARVNSYEKLLNQEAEQRREDLEIYIPPGPRLGDVVFGFDSVTKSFEDLNRKLFERMVAALPDRPELLKPIFGIAFDNPRLGRGEVDRLFELLQRPSIAKCVRLGRSYRSEWSDAAHPKHRLYELANASCQDFTKADIESLLSHYDSPEESGPSPLNATGLCQFVIDTEGMERKGRAR